jgi:hypothetical protein
MKEKLSMELQRIDLGIEYSCSIQTENIVQNTPLMVGLHHIDGKSKILKYPVARALFTAYDGMRDHFQRMLYDGTVVYTCYESESKIVGVAVKKRKFKNGSPTQRRWRLHFFDMKTNKLTWMPLQRQDLLVMFNRADTLRRLYIHWEVQQERIARHVQMCVVPEANMSLLESSKRALLKYTKPGKFMSEEDFKKLPKQMQEYLTRWSENEYVLNPICDLYPVYDFDCEEDF